ncbi:MAG: hypothetical protein ACREJB_14550 [Planctomycetaceae bacterium]
MKKASSTPQSDELWPEYDGKILQGGVRGKYAKRYAAGTNLVRLEPDVAAAFASDEAVNEALRLVVRFADDAGRLRQTRRAGR